MSLRKGGKDRHRPTTLAMFNAAYDLVYLEPIVNDTTRIENSSHLITVRLKNGIPVLDLTNYVEGSLADWIRYLEMEKYGIEKVGEGEDIKSLGREELRRRCQLDAKATWFLANWLEDFFVNTLKTPVSNTLAASTFNLYQYHFFPDSKPWRRRGEANDFERESFRGGRVETFKRGLQHVHKYDINGMYLSIQRDCLFPNPCSYSWSKDDRGFDERFGKHLMVVRAAVTVPKQRIAPLPYKSRKLDRLIFPVGRFSGVFTSPELLYAVTNCGVEIEEVYEYITYFKAGQYFKQFADFVYDERRKFKEAGNTGAQLMMKRIGNSLQGKWGQSNGPPSKWIRISQYKGRIKGKDIREIPAGSGNNEVYVGNGEKYDSTHTFPIIASLVASYARVKLLKMLKEYEDHVVYCDTDSLFMNEKPFEGSDELGEFKYEGESTEEFFRSKFYGSKCKGVPTKRARIVENTLTQRVYEYERPIRRNEGIRNGKTPNKWVTVRKVMSKIDDKRKWISDGESWPVPVEEEIERRDRQ